MFYRFSDTKLKYVQGQVMDFVLGFDGGNAQDLAMYGYLIYTVYGDEVTVVGEGNGKCHDELQTNNVAEWSALLYGLMAVLPQIVTMKREFPVQRLMLHGDSQLVLRQLTGEYGITKDHLRYYYDKCCKLVERIEQEGVQVITDWERRDSNEGPDKLTHRARSNYLDGYGVVARYTA
jgi:ribonuclease HI